jgi:hypothetical protein
MQHVIEDYAHWALQSIPTNDPDNFVYYCDDPHAMPRLLEDGFFAEPVIEGVLPDSIFTSLYSGAISILWGNEQAVVVRVHPDEPTLDTPPCETEGFFDGNVFCDADGYAWLLIHYPSNGDIFQTPDQDIMDTFKSLKGVDKLGDYGMTIETVVRATQNAANRNGGKPYYEWSQDGVMEHFSEDPKNLEQFVAFNLPYCDLVPGTEDLTIDYMECDAEVNPFPHSLPFKISQTTSNITLSLSSAKSPTESPNVPCSANGPKISSNRSSGTVDVNISAHPVIQGVCKVDARISVTPTSLIIRGKALFFFRVPSDT